jgi:O-antigen ligase
MSAQPFPRQPPASESLSPPYALWVGVAIASGVAIGAASSISLTGAIALATAIGLLIWVIPRPGIMLTALIASVFVQVITVGGVTIARICAPIALLVVVVALLRRKATLQPAAPLGWAAAYALWAVASGLWSTHLGNTLNQIASLGIGLSYMLAFATLLNNRRDVSRVLYTVALVAFAVGIYGMISSQGRAGTDTGDANYFALVEIVALPLVLALSADVRVRWLRIALYGAVLVIVAAVFSSLSRGGLIALAAAVLGVVALPSRTFFRSPKQKLLVVLLLVVATFGAYKLTAQALSQRIEEVFTTQGRTGSGRINAWRAASTSIRERPFEGLGYGAFEPSANELMLRTPGVDLSNQRLRANGLEAHSAYIGTLAELGIPGLLLFVGLFGSTALTIRRVAVSAAHAGAPSSARLANALLISLLGWAVASTFLSSETSRPPWIVIGICLALPKLVADELRRNEEGETEPQP